MPGALDLDVGPLRKAIEAGDLAAAEVASAALERAAELSHLNAFVETRHAAVEEAEAAAGPLGGVPLAVKDTFVDRDRIPTCGSGAGGDWLRGTATTVDRLRRAGAVVVGYSNLHEWAVGTTSAVTRTGPIRNPWDASVVSGGSSGGSAAALAAGIVPAAIGTDAGGSIRCPAACCGITGFKPTWDRVPTRGFVGDGGLIDHAGPLARSVDAVTRLFAVMADEEVPHVDASGLKVGLPRSFFFDDLDAGVAAAVDAAIEVLASVVRDVREVDLPSAATASFAVPALFLPLLAGRLATVLDERPEALQPQTARLMELGRGMTEGDVDEAMALKGAVAAEWDSVFRDVDLVVTPTIPAPPAPAETLVVDLPSGQTSAELAYIRLNAPMNLGGVPALSLPCGELPNGLTTSITLTAARGADATALAAGAAFERATGGVYAGRIAPL